MYSQHDEEQSIIANTPEAGRFLDIGAFNARQLSNTRALYERGWSGVMVEPSPGPMRGLVAEYGTDDRMTLVAALVGQMRSLERLYVTDDAVSTVHRGNYEAWKADGGFIGSLFVPQLTVEDLINQFGSFEFVSIDAEGSSVSIFGWLLKTAMRPNCICVEHESKMHECLMLAQGAGYRLVLTTDENLVFAR